MRRLALFPAMLGLFLVLTGSPALAHLDTADPYTHGACPASPANRVDPINVVFTKWIFPVPCGHAVDSNGPGGSGFDQGRDELESKFTTAGHSSYRLWWGNTRSFKQCDGDYAASDGWMVFIELHQVGH